MEYSQAGLNLDMVCVGPVNFKDSKNLIKSYLKHVFGTLEITFYLMRTGYHMCILILQSIEYVMRATVQMHSAAPVECCVSLNYVEWS